MSKQILQDAEAKNTDANFDVKWSCAVRRAMLGQQQPVYLWSYDMTLAQLQRIVGKNISLFIIQFKLNKK